MTVSKLIKMRVGADRIETVWFEGNKKQTDTFDSETLMRTSGIPGVA
jgi:hypothetical protein